METRNNEILSEFFPKTLVTGLTSINDLREKEYSGEDLTKQETLALSNFDRYRIAILNEQRSEADFHEKYRELQAMANLNSFEEFLNEKYCMSQSRL